MQVTFVLTLRRNYLTSDLPEGGLIERGLIREEGLFTKSNDKDIFGSFSVLYLIFCGINIQFCGSNT